MLGTIHLAQHHLDKPNFKRMSSRLEKVTVGVRSKFFGMTNGVPWLHQTEAGIGAKSGVRIPRYILEPPRVSEVLCKVSRQRTFEVAMAFTKALTVYYLLIRRLWAMATVFQQEVSLLQTNHLGIFQCAPSSAGSSVHLLGLRGLPPYMLLVFSQQNRVQGRDEICCKGFLSTFKSKEVGQEFTPFFALS